MPFLFTLLYFLHNSTHSRFNWLTAANFSHIRREFVPEYQSDVKKKLNLDKHMTKLLDFLFVFNCYCQFGIYFWKFKFLQYHEQEKKNDCEDITNLLELKLTLLWFNFWFFLSNLLFAKTYSDFKIISVFKCFQKKLLV